MNDDVPQTDWQWVSVSQASAMTGLSPSTIRRKIRERATIAVPGHGQFILEGEREERPQGSLFLVRLPKGLQLPAERDASTDPDPGVTELPVLVSDGAEELIARLGPILQGPWKELADRLGAENVALVERLLAQAEETAGFRQLLSTSNKLAAEAIACRDKWRELAMSTQVTASDALDRAVQLERQLDEAEQQIEAQAQITVERVANLLIPPAPDLPMNDREEGFWERIGRYLGALNPF